jgi:hypothetical protein
MGIEKHLRSKLQYETLVADILTNITSSKGSVVLLMVVYLSLFWLCLVVNLSLERDVSFVFSFTNASCFNGCVIKDNDLGLSNL